MNSSTCSGQSPTTTPARSRFAIHAVPALATVICTWTQLSSDPGYRPRNDFSTHGPNDIWYSADGVRWTRQTEHAPWGPRSPKTVVFKDRLWIYSGKHTGAPDNWGGDLWQMTPA